MNVSEIIKQLVPSISDEAHLVPSEFIRIYWEKYKATYGDNRSINGKIFEKLIAMTLVRRNLLPFYMQAQVAFIPTVNYDFVIYTADIGPIVLSAKTSLRERYKQAVLEAIVLKNIHRKSESYLISLEEKEINSRKRNMDGVMALNDIIYAGSDEYDKLLDSLATKSIIVAPTVKVVHSNPKYLISLDNSQNIYD